MTHKARCLKDEPGTLQFEILLPRDDNTKVLLYEVYRDDAAGPNLNLLGVREPHIYGLTTLAAIKASCEEFAKSAGAQLSFHQSNHEGALVDLIQAALNWAIKALNRFLDRGDRRREVLPFTWKLHPQTL